MKKKNILLVAIVSILIILAFSAIVSSNKQILIPQEIQDVIIALTPNKDKKMINQIINIINQVKENESTEINSIYWVKDINEMGIDISVSPFGTSYSDESYITNFNGIYYASFDNGKQKVSGNEDDLEFGKLGLFNPKSRYSVSEEEAKILIQKKLKSKYGEEFDIVTLYLNSDIYGFHGYEGTVQPSNNKITQNFDVMITREGNVYDEYYDFLVDDEYKKMIIERISKIDNKIKIIQFSNVLIYPYGDSVYKELSLQEALSKKIISKNLYIITYTDLSDEEANQIEEALRDIQYRGQVIIFKTDKKTFSEVDNLTMYSKLENAQKIDFSLYD